MLKQVLCLCVIALLFAACGGGDAGDPKGNNVAASGNEETPPPTEVKVYEKPKEEVIENRCEVPQSMADLTGGIKQLFYQMTSQNGGALSLFGMVNVSLGRKETMVIVDFIQYKDTKCEKENVRYGVGARLFLHVKKAHMGGKADYNNLEYLAANVQLGKATVEYSIQTVGITGDAVLAALPKTSNKSFDVSGYRDVMASIDNIRDMAKDGLEGVNIDPQIIPTDK